MLKQTATFILTTVFAVAALADPPPLLAAPTPAPSAKVAAKKKKKKVKKTVVAKSTQPPTRLPEFKGPKHVTLDFNSPSEGTHTTTVVVRTPLPVDEAYEENAIAEKNLKSLSMPDFKVTPTKKSQVSIAPALAPEPTLASNSSMVLVSKSAPTPAPVYLIPIQEPVVQHKAYNAPVPAAPQVVQQPVQIVAPQPEPAMPPEMFAIDTRVAEAHAGPLELTEPLAQEKSHVSQKSDSDSGATATRISIGTSYLDAKYSQLEGDLQDGASAFSLGLARDWGPLEIGATLDFGYGMDQAVTLQNTRYVLLQGNADYFFLPGWVSPFAGAGLGVGSFNVFSYRSTTSDPNTTLIRENDQTTALLLSPTGGVRFNVAEQVSIDLKLQYLLVIGGDNSSALGGFLAGASVGFKF
jgi:opacity protein-like surface antigen